MSQKQLYTIKQLIQNNLHNVLCLEQNYSLLDLSYSGAIMI